MSRLFFLTAAYAIAACVLPAAAAHVAIDYGILGAPTTADTNEFGGLQKTPESDLHIFRYFEAEHPKALSDPKKSEADKIDLLVTFIGYQRALFYAAASGAPKLVTSDDWTLIRHDEFDLVAVACGGQTRAAARYGLTDAQCNAWFKANQATLQKMQREQTARRNR
jgi:hypothetical protein